LYDIDEEERGVQILAVGQKEGIGYSSAERK